MKRSLAMAALALGLIALGCDDNPSNPDAPVAGSGGKGGTGGAGGTGGTGGGTGGTGGVKMDGKPADKPATADRAADTGGADKPATDASDASHDTSVDTGGAAADICAGYNMGTAGGVWPNIATADFCKEYMTTCGFGTAMRYASMQDCTDKYGAAATSVKSCRAAHVCNAKVGGNDAAKTTHCPHAFDGNGQIAACM